VTLLWSKVHGVLVVAVGSAVVLTAALAAPVRAVSNEASVEVHMSESKSKHPSARKTCKAAEAAAAELQQARRSADQAGIDRAQEMFVNAERQAPNDLPRDLAAQLRLVNRTLDDPPGTPVVLREVRLSIARLVHGLTGVMLACDRVGVRTTIEY
jgi:hypothetical protein